MDWARLAGYGRLWATVWEWNTASRRVLEKLGFTEAGLAPRLIRRRNLGRGVAGSVRRWSRPRSRRGAAAPSRSVPAGLADTGRRRPRRTVLDHRRPMGRDGTSEAGTQLRPFDGALPGGPRIRLRLHDRGRRTSRSGRLTPPGLPEGPGRRRGSVLRASPHQLSVV
ncbi:N-acetyltransferase family protein [Amycolatopsis ponsaeliensis]|uniref:GNAT family N-acetyltransferase n=1 Tax=Amycolatopsis ponsaeliensis TaxID=2992142 RepID=UPI003D9C35FE